MSKAMDRKNAIVKVYCASRTAETCDWASMVYRMIARYCERHGYEVDELDYQPDEGVGLESATIKVSGPMAYRYLRSEAGIHRLVRMSPFDAQGQRHTTFVAVEVVPCCGFLLRLLFLPRRNPGEWASNIRTYTMHPYQEVMDHRTGIEVEDVRKVLDGHLDVFVNGYLKAEGHD